MFFSLHLLFQKIFVEYRLLLIQELIQSMKFSRAEHWSGKLFPSPEDFPNPGMEPRFPALQVDSLPAEPQGKPKNTGVGSLFFFSRFSWPRNWTWVSSIAGRFFTNWAIREAHILSVSASIYCSFDSLVIFCILSICCWIYLLNFYFSCFKLQFKQFHLVLYTFYFFTDTFHFFVENFI